MASVALAKHREFGLSVRFSTSSMKKSYAGIVAGRCSASQRVVRKALLRAGADWWECRSANAAMWALSESGVEFREVVYEDGTVERWRQPELAPWEVPRRDPSEPRPRHPEFAAQLREAARRRWER